MLESSGLAGVQQGECSGRDCSDVRYISVGPAQHDTLQRRNALLIVATNIEIVHQIAARGASWLAALVLLGHGLAAGARRACPQSSGCRYRRTCQWPSTLPSD